MQWSDIAIVEMKHLELLAETICYWVRPEYRTSVITFPLTGMLPTFITADLCDRLAADIAASRKPSATTAGTRN